MNREILRLAIPNIIANISVPMLGIVDTALVGHMEAVYTLERLLWARWFLISFISEWDFFRWEPRG